MPVSHLPDPARQPEFYADVPAKRAIAWLIDGVLITALILPVILFTAFIGLFFLPVLFLVVGFIYRWMTIAGGSATLGMRLMAIEFRNAHGERLDGGEAFLHTLGYTISFSMPLIQVVSIVLMLTSARGQGLSDHVLGTVAINRRAR